MIRLLVSAYAYLSPKPRNGCLYLRSYSSLRVVTFSQVVTPSVYNLGRCRGGNNHSTSVISTEALLYILSETHFLRKRSHF